MTALTYKDALNELDDRRIKSIKPLLPPQILIEEYPLTLQAAQTVASGRKATEEIVKHEDDRLLVVVGPCSIHDVRPASNTPASWLRTPRAPRRTCTSSCASTLKSPARRWAGKG